MNSTDLAKKLIVTVTLLFILCFWRGTKNLSHVYSQSLSANSTPTIVPVETDTPLPAVTNVTSTPVATVAPTDNLIEQAWQANKISLMTGFIAAIIASILVGVFLKSIAESLKKQTSQLFHFLFDRFASTPILRFRYDKAYRTTLSAFVQQLQSSNIVDRDVPLDKVYVPIGLTEEIHNREHSPVTDRLAWEDERRRRQRDNAIDIWAALDKKPRLVVLGDPGAGKTTSLYHMAFKCAEKERLADYTPIFMRLRDLIREPKLTRLEDALPEEFASRTFPNADSFIKNRLNAGKCLLLFDGLDEVDNADQHQEAIALVQDFADRHAIHAGDEKRKLGNRIVVSCRTYSYEAGAQLNGFAKTMVMDFEQSEIEQFIYNWFSHEGQSGELTRELSNELRKNRRFSELARNPLLLLLIAHHYERERNLPDVRAELYRDCISTRIKRWNTVRGTHRGRFGETNKWRMLRELALHLFQQEQSGERVRGRSAFIGKEELLDWVEEFTAGIRMPENATAADLLNEVADDSGLIVERAIGRFGFSHQTLQEYFAAEAIDRLGAQDGATLLADYLGDERWREVILLYCGLADNAEPLIEKIISRAEDVAQSPSTTNAWLQAARCLAEGANQISASSQSKIINALFAVLRATNSHLKSEQREEILELLAELDTELITVQVAQLPLEEIDSLQLASHFVDKINDDSLRHELTQHLTQLMSSGSDEEQTWAAAALGRSGESADVDTIAALRQGLNDPSPDVQAETCRSLARLNAQDESTLQALETLYYGDVADMARHAALDALLTLGQHERMGMVPIPAGEFLMGSTDKDGDAKDDEKPQHKIYLSDYFIERTPVTNAAFRRFMEAGGYINSMYWKEAIDAKRWQDGIFKDYSGERSEPAYWADSKWNGDGQPVVGITWYEAVAYARWAGKRLPTEAEWEKAARGTDGRIYPWGNEWDETLANTKETGLGQTTPVGQYSPDGDSPYGMVDMAGNVFEWCSSRYAGYPYEANDGREDFSGGDRAIRVLRGGSWANAAEGVRCARRNRYSPYLRDYYYGFRCSYATSS